MTFSDSESKLDGLHPKSDAGDRPVMAAAWNSAAAARQLNFTAAFAYIVSYPSRKRSANSSTLRCGTLPNFLLRSQRGPRKRHIFTDRGHRLSNYSSARPSKRPCGTKPGPLLPCPRRPPRLGLPKRNMKIPPRALYRLTSPTVIKPTILPSLCLSAINEADLLKYGLAGLVRKS